MKKLEEDLDCKIIHEFENLNEINFQKLINENKYDQFIKSYINFNEEIPLEHPWKTIDKQLGKL